MGEERLATLVQESLTVAVKTGAAKPADFTRVIIDHGAGEGDHLPDRRQADAYSPPAAGGYGEEGGRRSAPELRAGRQARADRPPKRYAHAEQFNRANRALKAIRTMLDRSSAILASIRG